MKKIAIIAIALWSAACSKEEAAAPAGAHSEIRIAGEIGQTESQSTAQCLTRASEIAFEKGDEIGLRVEHASVLGYRNARLTHNGNVFTGKQIMWNETAGDAVLWACYPYVEGGDIPMSLSVPLNQQIDAEFARADFLAASRSVTVKEFAEPVQLQFRHVFSKVIINVTDETAAKPPIDHLSIQNLKNGAVIDYANREASVLSDADPANMTSHKVDDLKHEVILVPQKADRMKIEVYTKGDEGVTLRYTKYVVKNVELKSGFRYKLNITLKDGEGEEVIEFDTVVAEIEPWDSVDELPDTQI